MSDREGANGGPEEIAAGLAESLLKAEAEITRLRRIVDGLFEATDRSDVLTLDRGTMRPNYYVKGTELKHYEETLFRLTPDARAAWEAGRE